MDTDQVQILEHIVKALKQLEARVSKLESRTPGASASHDIAALETRIRTYARRMPRGHLPLVEENGAS